MAGMLSSCSSSDDDPQPPLQPSSGQTITVTVSEAGAPSYPLRNARIVNSNYQSGSSYLNVTGALNSGKVLTLSFTRGTGNPPAFTTNVLEAALDGTAGTAAAGTTTYSTLNHTADGTFQATFPVVGVVNGSFTGVPIQ